MEIGWLELFMQIPLAGVVVLVVVIFLKTMEKLTGIFTTTLKEQREMNNEVTRELTKEISTMSKMMNECAIRLQGIDEKLDAHVKEKN
jgi:nitrate/nitrite-specific signal transduction histidine kinase